ncbi:MAG: hypothetical protein ABFS41_16830, partial [Myxococcota bacterium]
MASFPEVYRLLQSQPVLTLFLLLGSGYLIARVRVGSFSLGPVAGVLFAGLFFGHHLGLSTGDPVLTDEPLEQEVGHVELVLLHPKAPPEPGAPIGEQIGAVLEALAVAGV